jgi:hypothetical protein
MSDKIKPRHVARKAMLYIRRSSTYQVHHNRESQRLPYAMQDRLHHLGWREIDVVDDDLGRSAAGLVTRAMGSILSLYMGPPNKPGTIHLPAIMASCELACLLGNDSPTWSKYSWEEVCSGPEADRSGA